MKQVGSLHGGGWTRILASIGIGLILFFATSLLTADLILRGVIPETASSICLCASAAIGALIAGGVAGGGERRLLRAALVGVGCALGVLLAKGVCAKTTIWTWYTTTAIAESVAFSLLGSCIFHKSNKKRTKRKRKVKRKI